MPRYLLSGSLGMLGPALLLALSASTSVGSTPKGKVAPPVPKNTTGTVRDPFPSPRPPFPGVHAPRYHSHGPVGMGGGWGLSTPTRLGLPMPPGLTLGRCPGRFSAAPALTNACATCHAEGFRGAGRLGVTGVPGLDGWSGIAGDPVQRLLADLTSGIAPRHGGWRDAFFLNEDSGPEVMGLLLGRHAASIPGLHTPSRLHMLEPEIGLGGSGPLGRASPLGPRFASVHDVFDGIGALDLVLTRPGGHRPPWGNYIGGPGLPGGFDLLHPGNLEESLFHEIYGGMFGRHTGIGIGIGLPRAAFGPGFPGRIDPVGGRGMLPPPRPRAVVRGPSKDEKRAALAKFEKSLGGVETLARVGAWDVLGAGLDRAAGTSRLPPAVTAPLKGLQAEAARLGELLRLREALTVAWTAAPDPAALSGHIDAVRAATGDDQMADRLTRLLAVKALWEGHDRAAGDLLPGEAPDLDAGLEALRRPHLPDPEGAAPIATAEDRVAA